jgi:4-hydroxy-3-methylbut-2-en-1-yl diphosphate reductase
VTVAGRQDVVVVTATRMETTAARGILGEAVPVVRVGVGAHRLHAVGAPACVLSVGVCGALSGTLTPGDVVIPREVGTEDGRRWRCLPWLVDALLDAASDLRVPGGAGTLLTAPRLVTGPERAALACAGWDAVDMETAVLAAAGIPVAAVRIVLDGPAAELDPAWRHPAAAILQPRLWGEARRLAASAPPFARLAARVAGRALAGAAPAATSA